MAGGFFLRFPEKISVDIIFKNIASIMFVLIFLIAPLQLESASDDQYEKDSQLRILVLKMQDNVLYSRKVYKREIERYLYSRINKEMKTGYNYIRFSPVESDRQFRNILCYSDWMLIRIIRYSENPVEEFNEFTLYSITGRLIKYKVDPGSSYPVILYLDDVKIKKLEEN